MFLLRLCLFVFVNLFCYTKCTIPVEKLCAEPTCTAPISMAQTLIQYNPSEEGMLAFQKNQEVTVISKSKNKNDCWEILINGKKGCAPPNFLREKKVLKKHDELIVVNPEALQQSQLKSDEGSLKSQIPPESDQTKLPSTPIFSESVLSTSLEDSNSVEDMINSSKAFDVIEGTTIYADGADEITASSVEDTKFSPQTLAPPLVGLNKVAKQPERNTIPPAINSQYKAENPGNMNNFKVENVKENDEHATVESKDIHADEDEDDDEEDKEDEDDDVEDEENEDESEDEIMENGNEEVKNSQVTEKKVTEEIKKNENIEILGSKTQKKEEMSQAESQSIFPGAEENFPKTVVNIVKNVVTSQISSGFGDDKTKAADEQQDTSQIPADSTGQIPVASTSQFPAGTTGQIPAASTSQFPADTTRQIPADNSGQIPAASTSQFLANSISHIPADPASQIPMDSTSKIPTASTNQFPAGTTGQIPADNSGQIPPASTSQFPAATTGQIPVASTSQFPAGTTGQIPTASGSQILTDSTSRIPTASTSQYPAGTTRQIPAASTSQFLADSVRHIPADPASQITMDSTSKIDTASTSQFPAGTTGQIPAASTSQFPAATTKQIPTDSASQIPTDSTSEIPKVSAGQIPEDNTFQKIQKESTSEVSGTTPHPTHLESSTIFSHFSVSADVVEEANNNETQPFQPGIVQEKEIEMRTKDLDVELQSDTTASQNSEVPKSSNLITPEMIETLEMATETAVTEGSFTEEPKVTEETKETSEQGMEESNTSPENGITEPGMLSQITGMISSWFTSSPGELPGEVSYETQEPLENFVGKEISGDELTKSFSEAPLGSCQNPELGVDCPGFASSEEQASSWNGWVPASLTVDGLLAQNNTFMYLVITAVTVLLFTLGHNFIEKRRKTEPLIAKINKLEQELLVTSKECILLKDEVQSAREKVTLYENSANDELVVSLQAELEESKKIRSELETSIEVLQQELDAVTEAGLDLNKMLSEVLTQKGGSETLLKSVENLQAQLDSQQKVIDEMNTKLGVKNQENEALQAALDAATEKSENLEEQLADIKQNFDLHQKEKEDLTKDLNSQISQLNTRINKLSETKEKEILKLKKELEAMRKKFSETAGELTVKAEEVKELKESMKTLKAKGNVKLETVFDVSRVKAELSKEIKENQSLMEKLQKEENNQKSLAEQVKVLESELQKQKKGFEELEQQKEEAEKKLEVLSTYFKEKETQLQKELGLQEALWAQKKGDEKAVHSMMKSLQEEVESYKMQNETLKKEILDQERGLKSQMATLEQKAHENWVAARQAERKLEESKQEMVLLRNRLTLVEKNNSNVEGNEGIRPAEDLNGIEAASPILHDTSSPLLFPPLPLDPSNSSLLPPGFMPPPMFMPPPIGGFMPPPPFLPGDRRPPPLGRMSSPPLNNRFSPSSPADYPFERMSSPPLSPPGSNYRSNEEREHYRHRTPPLPPPLHPRNWDDGHEMPGFIPISSQRNSRRDHKGSNVSSEHSSSESLDKSSRHSGRV